jgi:hypothetical protein
VSDKSGSNEGAIVALGILLIVVCIAGSMITRTNFIDFLFILIFIGSLIFMTLGMIFGATVLFIYTFRRDPGDGRTIRQIVKAEYNSNKLICSYRLLFRLLGEYFSENQTYVLVIRSIEDKLQRLVWSAQHPVRAIRRDWDLD